MNESLTDAFLGNYDSFPLRTLHCPSLQWYNTSTLNSATLKHTQLYPFSKWQYRVLTAHHQSQRSCLKCNQRCILGNRGSVLADFYHSSPNGNVFSDEKLGWQEVLAYCYKQCIPNCYTKAHYPQDTFSLISLARNFI